MIETEKGKTKSKREVNLENSDLEVVEDGVDEDPREKSFDVPALLRLEASIPRPRETVPRLRISSSSLLDTE